VKKKIYKLKKNRKKTFKIENFEEKSNKKNWKKNKEKIFKTPIPYDLHKKKKIKT